ncbi:hypothetical protein RJZ57_006830 [Blastomyces gilchristii]
MTRPTPGPLTFVQDSERSRFLKPSRNKVTDYQIGISGQPESNSMRTMPERVLMYYTWAVQHIQDMCLPWANTMLSDSFLLVLCTHPGEHKIHPEPVLPPWDWRLGLCFDLLLAASWAGGS